MNHDIIKPLRYSLHKKLIVSFIMCRSIISLTFVRIFQRIHF